MTVHTIQAHAIEILVVVMMLAVGLKLTIAELFLVRKQLGTLGLGLAVNFVVAPAIAYALCTGFELDESLAIALLLCACAPGGPVGPLYVSIARGDLAYGVALMVVLVAVSTVTTPILLVLVFLPDDASSAGQTTVALMKTMIGFQLLPLMLGLALRQWREALALRLAAHLTRLSNALLVVVIAGILFAKGEALAAMDARALVAMHIAVLSYLLIGGIAGGRAAGIARASALSTGVRNLAMALLLSASHFPDPQTDAAILSFGFIMLIIPAILALYWKHSSTEALS